MKNIVAGGKTNQRTIRTRYIVERTRYVINANGRYINFIKIPNT